MTIMRFILFLMVILASRLCSQKPDADKLELVIVTVATEETDGYKRLMHTIKYFNHEVLVFGMNEEWFGGNMMYSPGGGQKVSILKNNLGTFEDAEDTILMFVDSYDVTLLGEKEAILKEFLSMNSRIVFSAENTLWPDKSLRNLYPQVDEKRFLCSGAFIGYAKEFWMIINQGKITNGYSDQLYYTLVYLNATLREKLNVSLDHTSRIFHNLNFARDEVALEVREKTTVVKNIKYNTYPLVLHGNGPSKLYLNHLGNYAPDGWHPTYGCQNCDVDDINIEYDDERTIPHVLIAVFVIDRTPFLEKFFDRIANLDYPKSSITIYIHYNGAKEEVIVEKFLSAHQSFYGSIKTSKGKDEWTARNVVIDYCLHIKCDYLFSIDSIVQLTNISTLKYLVQKNKNVIAPLVKRHERLWSNFWGALNADGFYARSDDYMDIINGDKVGVWNVPYISSVYLIKGSLLKSLTRKLPMPYQYEDLDPDMAFCQNLRDQYTFMYVSNEVYFGRLTHMQENSLTRKTYPDMWEIERNSPDWEDKYIHPLFWDSLEPETEVEQACPDVYKFPLMTEAYADQLIATAEELNMWSNGNHTDRRIYGGYEYVPTIDVHMNQIGYEKEWLHLLKHYASRLIQKVYPGFYPKAQSSMMFIVRYKPDEQSSLRPHHDSSTWTMSVALNNQGEDYEEGGCRFLRYNCSVTGLPKGWALVHPGRLTHYHEGLNTTKGTRYIFVSFVDP